MTRDDIINAMGWHEDPIFDQTPDRLLSRIERVVAQAESQERERNAQIADAHASCEGIARAIATEIRSQP